MTRRRRSPAGRAARWRRRDRSRPPRDTGSACARSGRCAFRRPTTGTRAAGPDRRPRRRTGAGRHAAGPGRGRWPVQRHHGRRCRPRPGRCLRRVPSCASAAGRSAGPARPARPGPERIRPGRRAPGAGPARRCPTAGPGPAGLCADHGRRRGLPWRGLRPSPRRTDRQGGGTGRQPSRSAFHIPALVRAPPRGSTIVNRSRACSGPSSEVVPGDRVRPPGTPTQWEFTVRRRRARRSEPGRRRRWASSRPFHRRSGRWPRS